jgi:FkbM family methyltransferase
MPVSLYRAKRAVLTPYTAYKRRQSRDLDQITRAILESQYYRPTIFEFMGASADNPDILVEADLDRSSIVLDIGAYVGEWSAAISQRYGARIYAFEPNPHSVREMRKRMGGDENIQLFDYALGAEDATIDLFLEGPGSTMFAKPGVDRTVEAQVRDVVGVLDELGIGHVDLCKVNIEGGEYDLFDRLLASGWLPRIRYLSIQFHEWHPHAYARRRALRRAFARTHDEVWDYPFVWELWRRREDTGAPAAEPVQDA